MQRGVAVLDVDAARRGEGLVALGRDGDGDGLRAADGDDADGGGDDERAGRDLAVGLLVRELPLFVAVSAAAAATGVAERLLGLLLGGEFEGALQAILVVEEAELGLEAALEGFSKCN